MVELAGWSISPKLYRWLLTNFEAGTSMLEFGSGNATTLIAKHFNLVSVEHDESWLNLAETFRQIYAPIHKGWYSRQALALGLADDHFDVVLVDGPPKVIGRQGLLTNLDLFYWRNVCVIFDDTQREAEQKLVEQFKAAMLVRGIPVLACSQHSGSGKSWSILRLGG